MSKNYPKHFRSTGVFFNNSAIILKLIWPETTHFLYFKFFFFQKQCGRYAELQQHKVRKNTKCPHSFCI